MSAFAAASISTSITAGAAAPARRSLVRRSSVRARRHTAGIVTTSAVANAADENNNDDDNKDAAERVASRREALAGTALAAALALSTTAETVTMRPALAAGLPKVVVVGATGQTGQLVVAELRKRSDAEVIAAVRSGGKAKKMGLDAGGVTLLPGFDVTADAASLVDGLKGADVAIVCTGFVPGNPFKMAEAAHAVDNEGVVHLVDAAKSAGVKRVVLVSSILTDGRAMGAEDSPGFKITNAFGGVLDEKLVGEKHLQASGVEYCIVRPAGLRAEPPKTKLIVTPGNVMASGEVSRQLVAEVMVEAAFAPGAANKIVEIAEEGTFAPGYTPDGVEEYLVGEDKSKWF